VASGEAREKAERGHVTGLGTKVRKEQCVGRDMMNGRIYRAGSTMVMIDGNNDIAASS
jgi:hypothetical protein